MTSSVAEAEIREACDEVLMRLATAGAHIRKTVTGWKLFAGGAAAAGEAIAGTIVAALLARGHLVPRPQGGLETLRRAELRSGRLTSHRPPRPAPEQAAGNDAPLFNDAESPLSWLRSRKDKKGRPLIASEQFLAGERLRADYERSCLAQRTTASWDPSATAGRGGGNAAASITDGALAARQNLQRALDAVGPELSGMLVQVCCLSAGIEQAERLLEMPQRSGKAVLGLALTSLARHYGYLKSARAHGGSHIGHWGLPGFRPEIAPQAES